MNYGSNQYARAANAVVSPRETEATAFVFVNRLLRHAPDANERIRGLAKNQQLWSLLLKDVGSSSNTLPPILKSDLAALGMWVMRHSIAAMGDERRSLEALIDVNEDMIVALRTSTSTASMPAVPGPLALAG